MKKFIKIVLIVVVSFIGFIFILGIISNNTRDKDTPTQTAIVEEAKQEEAKQVVPKTWDEMTYEERQIALEQLIKERDFSNSHLAEKAVRDFVKDNVRNPKTIKYKINPSIYNGSSIVVEADSAWIFTHFSGTAKNDFGIEKPFTGTVMYKCSYKEKHLDIHNWKLSIDTDY